MAASRLTVSPSALTLDAENLNRKNDELAQAYKDKSRKLLQTQELYDKLKRKAMLGQLQDAATDAAESQLHGAENEGEGPTRQAQTHSIYPSQADHSYGDSTTNNRFDRGIVASSYTRPYGTTRVESGWGRQPIPHGA